MKKSEQISTLISVIGTLNDACLGYASDVNVAHEAADKEIARLNAKIEEYHTTFNTQNHELKVKNDLIRDLRDKVANFELMIERREATIASLTAQVKE